MILLSFDWAESKACPTNAVVKSAYLILLGVSIFFLRTLFVTSFPYLLTTYLAFFPLVYSSPMMSVPSRKG